jgi:Mg-chelatase subunit ChlI
MGLWNSAQKLEIFPEPERTPIDRVRELETEMRAAHLVLTALDAELKAFRGRHKIHTDLLDRIVGCEGSIREQQAIFSQWQLLQRRKARALHTFSEKEKVWSDALMEAK